MNERLYHRRKLANQIMLTLTGIATAIAVVMLVLILGYTVVHGIAYLDIGFLTGVDKPFGETGGGMRYEIIGTAILILIASVIAIPVGLMTGIFLSDFGGQKTASTVRFVADILAGVPSIVVGVFAYGIMVRPMHSYSALSGGVALAIIMIPVVARTAEESLRLVPNTMREAALALGITRWRAMLGVIIPGALTGILTGVMLGVARIAGETAPLIFTAFGNQFGPDGLLKAVGALPLSIYHYALSPYKDWHEQAWAGAFVLVIFVLLISIIVRWVGGRRSGHEN